MVNCREFCGPRRLFAKHRVEYVIVGRSALGQHGAPRYTGDIDLSVRPTDENARRVLAALGEFGFGSLDIQGAGPNRAGRVVQLGFPRCRVDIVTGIDGGSFDEAAKAPSPGTYGDVPVPFLSRELLLRNKRTTGRAKDLADIEALDTSDASSQE